MKITGNTILITGGTSGIGLGFAEEFYRLGNTAIICGRREDRLSQIAKKYPAMITKTCDVADAKQREELAAWTIKNYPAVNMLMNNAGIELATDLKQPVKLERVEAEIGTNLIAPIHLSSLFAQHLAGKDNAAVINITSGLAYTPLAFMAVYCCTKAAVHSFTQSLRHQLKQSGTKVFEIIPPSVDTELGHDMRADKTQSHGGLPINEFIAEAMEAIKNDLFEAPVGHAKNLYEKREAMFSVLNK
ncbi:MAG: SDR family oxidoreductase [Chitinophagales bacterium]